MNRQAIRLEQGAEPVPGYRLVRILGQGGCGAVWLADELTGAQRALKFLPAAERAADRELQSLKLLQDISHPAPDWHCWLLAESGLPDRRHRKAWRTREQPVGSLHGSQGFEAKAGFPAPRDCSNTSTKRPKPLTSSIRGLSRPRRYQAAQSAAHQFRAQGERFRPGPVAGAHPQHAHGGGRHLRLLAAGVSSTARRPSSPDQYALAVTWCHLRGGRLPFAGTPAQVMMGHMQQQPDA